MSNDKITAGYAAAIVSTDKLEQSFAAVRRELKANLDAYAEFAEERRREQDKLIYDMETARTRKEAEYAEQDRQREEALAARLEAITDAEDELLSLLGLSRVAGASPGPKTVAKAYEAAIAKARAEGVSDGSESSAKNYAIAKRIDEANASKALALLEQEAKYLRERNASLEVQNAKLTEQVNANLAMMKDLGKSALEASAGIQGKANTALADAATASATPRGR